MLGNTSRVYQPGCRRRRYVHPHRRALVREALAHARRQLQILRAVHVRAVHRAAPRYVPCTTNISWRSLSHSLSIAHHIHWHCHRLKLSREEVLVMAGMKDVF